MVKKASVRVTGSPFPRPESVQVLYLYGKWPVNPKYSLGHGFWSGNLISKKKEVRKQGLRVLAKSISLISMSCTGNGLTKQYNGSVTLLVHMSQFFFTNKSGGEGKLIFVVHFCPILQLLFIFTSSYTSLPRNSFLYCLRLLCCLHNI